MCPCANVSLGVDGDIARLCLMMIIQVLDRGDGFRRGRAYSCAGRSLRLCRRVERHRLVTISPLSRPAKVLSLRASGRHARRASRALRKWSASITRC